MKLNEAIKDIGKGELRVVGLINRFKSCYFPMADFGNIEETPEILRVLEQEIYSREFLRRGNVELFVYNKIGEIVGYTNVNSICQPNHMVIPCFLKVD